MALDRKLAGTPKKSRMAFRGVELHADLTQFTSCSQLWVDHAMHPVEAPQTFQSVGVGISGKCGKISCLACPARVCRAN